MTIERPKYIEQLMNARGNGLVKIVTGIRRCGKSFLLSTLFVDELKKAGNSEDNIMFVNMDNIRSRKYRNPETLLPQTDRKRLLPFGRDPFLSGVSSRRCCISA